MVITDDTLENIARGPTAGSNDVTCVYAAKSLAPLFYEIKIPDSQTKEVRGKEHEKVIESIIQGELGKSLYEAAKTNDLTRSNNIVEEIERVLTQKGVAADFETFVAAVDKHYNPEMAKREEEQLSNSVGGENRFHQEFLDDLRDAGIATNHELNAFLFADQVGQHLYRQVPSKRGKQPDIKRVVSSKALFESEQGRLQVAISSGIEHLAAYYDGNHGVQPTKMEMVVPDFESRTMQWFLNEIYLRESKGEFGFLDSVLMSVDSQNVAWRVNWDFRLLACKESFKWSVYCGKK